MLYKLQKRDADGEITDIREFSHEHHLIEAQSECDSSHDLQILVLEGAGKLNRSIIYPVDDDLFDGDDDGNEVDLIASGYEWTCPECGTLVNEIEATEEVQCPQCENKYKTSSPEHAYE